MFIIYLIREILLYEFQLGHNVDEAIRNIYRAKGKAALKKPAAYECFKKILLCVWQNFEGVVYFELILDGHAINTELYSAQLKRMYVCCNVSKVSFFSKTMQDRILQLVRQKRLKSCKWSFCLTQLIVLLHQTTIYSDQQNTFYVAGVLKMKLKQKLSAENFLLLKLLSGIEHILLFAKRQTNAIEHDGLYFAD